MSNTQEAIELLKATIRHPLIFDDHTDKRIIDALALLESATKTADKSEPGEFTKDFRHTLKLGPKTRNRTARIIIMGLTACGRIDRLTADNEEEKLRRNETVAMCEQLQAENRNLKEKLKAKDAIIEEFARHKHNCKMGEYNSIMRGEGCDCGLSKALKGQNEMAKSKTQQIKELRNEVYKLQKEIRAKDAEIEKWKGKHRDACEELRGE